jgi:hypothetical protein
MALSFGPMLFDLGAGETMTDAKPPNNSDLGPNQATLPALVATLGFGS